VSYLCSLAANWIFYSDWVEKQSSVGKWNFPRRSCDNKSRAFTLPLIRYDATRYHTIPLSENRKPKTENRSRGNTILYVALRSTSYRLPIQTKTDESDAPSSDLLGPSSSVWLFEWFLCGLGDRLEFSLLSELFALEIVLGSQLRGAWVELGFGDFGELVRTDSKQKQRPALTKFQVPVPGWPLRLQQICDLWRDNFR